MSRSQVHSLLLLDFLGATWALLALAARGTEPEAAQTVVTLSGDEVIDRARELEWTESAAEARRAHKGLAPPTDRHFAPCEFCAEAQLLHTHGPKRAG